MARIRPPWHSLTADEVSRQLQVDPTVGLSAWQAKARLRRFGPNSFGQIKGPTDWELLVAQFKNIVMVLLLIATGISLLTGDVFDAVAIFTAILLSASIGFFTESRAERALEALRRLASPTARVLRAGNEEEIPTSELVPGDLAVLNAGGRVPADMRILEEDDLTVDEAALTGESERVDKQIGPLPVDTPLADRANMAYLGTTVAGGHALAVVVATGQATELGRIGRLIAEIPHEKTPLERGVEGFGRRLIWIVVGASALVTVVGLGRRVPLWLMLETGVSLAIAAVPESLPTVTTVALAWGLQRLVRRNVVVRRLAAVETLGSTTAVCADKTGTLTEGVMTVTAYALDGETIRVTGTGYRPEGQFLRDSSPVDPHDRPQLRLALVVGALCNNAALEVNAEAGWHGHGDPVEVALLVAAAKAGLRKPDLVGEYPRLGEISFAEKRKQMTTFHRAPAGGVLSFVKGAPEVVVAASSGFFTPEGERPLSDEDRSLIEARNQQMADEGLRVLALAYRRHARLAADQPLEGGLSFVGLVGMTDPPRPNVVDAIRRCKEAGIRPVMITGDQRRTAVAVARELGLLEDGDRRALEMSELAGLAGSRTREVLSQISVIARATPEDKLQIVRVLQEGGGVIAMTGDGINDAPALKAAHIGIALGAGAADVAKEAADMVITDNDFATIVVAIEQGRTIYANIRRAFRFLLTASFSAILAILAAIVAGIGLPMLPLQILWLNLIVHVFPAIALALEPGETGIMKHPPRDPREPILPWPLLASIVWRSLLIALATTIAFYSAQRLHGDGPQAVTIALATLGFAIMLHMFNARSERFLFRPGQRWNNTYVWLAFGAALGLQLLAFYAPPLQYVLRTVPLAMEDWVIILVWSAIPAILVELSKLLWPRVKRGRDRPPN
ncbi:MAG: cation-transporting P-type ATPase [Chloroflexi bacterium]|nr:cation-transporting P-type ATPase [Chloroflexota bacterium]